MCEGRYRRCARGDTADILLVYFYSGSSVCDILGAVSEFSVSVPVQTVKKLCHFLVHTLEIFRFNT